MSDGLSQQEVSALLNDVSAPEAAAGRLGAKVAAGTLTPAERQVAEQVLRAMMDGAAVQVRKVLSDTLKDSQFLPHDIAVALANDVESVALPVLQFSKVLSDEDLIAIVRAGAPAKQVAIAGRAEVSHAVAGELIQTDNNLAVATLIGNSGAVLDDKLIETAANRFGSDERVAQQLSKLPNLPLSVAERLVHFTVESLRAYIGRRTDMPESVITQIVLKTREQVTVDLRSAHFPAEEAIELVQHLHAAKRLTPSLILRALCVGDISLFEAAMSQLAGIAVHNARLLIHDAGQLGFKSLYDRTGMPQNYFPAFRIATQVAHETALDGGQYDRERYRRTMIERILTQFEEMGADDLDYLLIRLEDPSPTPPKQLAQAGA